MRILAFIVALAILPAPAEAQYIGNLTANPFAPTRMPPQPPGTFTNPHGNGSNSPRLFNDRGEFRGNLNTNPHDPDSVANPTGRYGSSWSPDSINNPSGQGSPNRPDSPSNPYGHGLRVYR
jgi:hypothetical protein